MSRLRVGLIDYGAGNLVSVRWALEGLGLAVRACRRPEHLVGCAAIVVPGVGASGPAMTRLRRSGLARAIPAAVADGAWYLGICLGLQLLFERSEEDGTDLLGLLAGDVRPIPDAPRLPHIGWNQVEGPRPDPLRPDPLRPDPFRPDPLLAALGPGGPAYFVHSYAAVPRDATVVVGETEYGSRFPSLIVAGRLLGTQFHPERSGAGGRRLLSAFADLAAGRQAEAA